MAVTTSWHYHTGTGGASSCEGATFGDAFDTDDRLLVGGAGRRGGWLATQRHLLEWKGAVAEHE